MRVPYKFRSTKNDTGIAPDSSSELRLLVPWSNPLLVFVHNLTDVLQSRVVPELETTSAPDHGFWRDVDLPTPFPRRGLLDSVFAHVALLGFLYAVSIWPHSNAHLEDPLSRRSLDGYTLSQYLPELHGAPTHPSARSGAQGKHDPVLAKQEILSLPKNPDNLRQTIVTPPNLKLSQDVDLPNIVAYAPVAPIQPVDASERKSASLRLPTFVPEVIAPSADTTALRSRSKLPTFETLVVEPTPDIAEAHPRLPLPSFQPKVVEPAPDLGNVSRGKSANLAHLVPHVAEPIPEPPHVSSAPHISAQIISLTIHPSEVQAPVKIPSGNRSGAFAASTSGRAEATGTPGAAANNGSGSAHQINAPEGISVGAANALGSPVANPKSASTPVDPNVRAKLMAAMHSPVSSIPPHQPIAHESNAPRSEVENKIFAGRRSYTLSVNMPNLNTFTGSWIIHFAENAPSPQSAVQSPIAAPEVLSKADPAYPGELIQDGVQGTVILTAIIRADGSVGNIAVAKSLDPRLDRNAAEALSRWLFRPALKNGQAIDLQAVITVPFRAKASGF